MKRTLVSWLGEGQDVTDQLVIPEGPNPHFHRVAWQHDRHHLLYLHPLQSIEAEILATWLKEQYPTHLVEHIPIPEGAAKNRLTLFRAVEDHLGSLDGGTVDLLLSSGNAWQQTSIQMVHERLQPATKVWDLVEEEWLQMDVAVSQISHRMALRMANQDDGASPQHMTPPMIQVYRQGLALAQEDRAALYISGGHGSGKVHLAQYIHQQSPRSAGPFEVLDCAKWPRHSHEQVLWETFWPKSEGGTLVLHNVDHLSSETQRSLWQYLTGAETSVLLKTQTDVRLIATAIPHLMDRCLDRQFLWELYYLLAHTELAVPSLQERGVEDIRRVTDLLLHHHMGRFNKTRPLTLKTEVRWCLEEYSWPGNVQELSAVIEYLYVMCDRDVHLKDLPARLCTQREAQSDNWRTVEAQHIRSVYERYGRNKSRACRALGYGSVNTLKKKLREYDIEEG